MHTPPWITGGLASPRIITLAFTLAAAACATEGSGGEVDEDEPSQLEVDLEASGTHLSGVTRIALTEDQRLAFVAGELGNESAVLDAFTNSIATARFLSERVDPLGYRHTRFAQTIDGLQLVGGDLRISRDPLGQVIAASGVSIKPSDHVSSPSVLVDGARSVALTSSEGANVIDAGELVYVAGSNLSPRLAWQFVVKGTNDDLPRHDLVFVDATSGAVVARHPKIHTARDRLTYDGNNAEPQADPDFNEFTLRRSEGDGAVGDPEIDTAHDSTGDVYACLNTLYDRDSYDNLGSQLISVVRIGNNFQNAFWNGTTMIYGEGFAEADVATHEIAHGVTEFTAGLIYMDESGALNEGSSDILMAICDIHKAGAIDDGTWIVGEDLPIGAIRSMSDPTSDGISSDHYSTRFTGPEDNGGVHLNSGIFNLYFVLLTEGGVHPQRAGEQEVVGVGFEKAAQIHYRALSVYMNQSTNFAAARVATEQAAVDLHGAGSAEAISVAEAWFAVGVGSAPADRPDPPVCGDGNIDADLNETCDDGNTTAGDGCDSSCVIEPVAECGDGNVDADNNETCDDGNTTAGDGCSATCTTEETDNGDGGCQTTPSSPLGGASWLLFLAALAFIRRRRTN